MKKLAVLGTAIALSNMTYAADAATQAQIDELKKALPKCFIRSNPTK